MYEWVKFGVFSNLNWSLYFEKNLQPNKKKEKEKKKISVQLFIYIIQ